MYLLDDFNFHLMKYNRYNKNTIQNKIKYISPTDKHELALLFKAKSHINHPDLIISLSKVPCQIS